VTVRILSVVMGVALAAGVAWAAADADAPERTAAQAAEDRDAPTKPLGPIYVRSFRPMRTSPVRLRERHGPVYFRSPLAEPMASDRDVDRNVPLACGVAVADWMIFTFRTLGFPVEMGLRPPWQSQRLGR